MTEKIIKITLIVIMFLGISFSIFNFISVEEVEAITIVGMQGSWEYFDDGSKECMGSGDECGITYHRY